MKAFLTGVGKRATQVFVNGSFVDTFNADTKANTDGVYDTMTVGTANEALSLATSVGVTDETPFAAQPVGGSSDVTTTYQKLNKLVACNVVKNQLFPGNFRTGSDIIAGVTFVKSGRKLVLNGTASESTNTALVTSDVQLQTDHKYLVVFNGKNVPEGVNIQRNYATNLPAYSVRTGSSSETTFRPTIQVTSGAVFTNTELEFFVVDLTLRYGSNDVVNAIIGSDSSKYVEKLIAFDPNILKDTDYDTGSFSECKTATLLEKDYNQWDEEWEVGAFDTTTGENITGTTQIRSKNLIPVIGGKKYAAVTSVDSGDILAMFYDVQGNVISLGTTGTQNNVNNVMRLTNLDSTYSIPVNAVKMKFYVTSQYGSTYRHDISVFLYWDGSRIGYEPYKEHRYPMPNVAGQGILKVVNGKVVAYGDVMTPDGSGNQTRYEIVDLGDLAWTKTYGATESDIYFVSNDIISLVKAPSSQSDVANISCTLIQRCSHVNNYNRNGGTGIAIATSGAVSVGDPRFDSMTVEQFRTAVTGAKLNYERATPAALTAPTFTSTFYGDDFGTMWWLDEDGNVIDGLQGNEIFYKANVSGFAESMYIEADGDPEYFAAASQLTDAALNARGYYKMADILQTIGASGMVGGTLRQQLAQKVSIDFGNTACKDMGELSFGHGGGAPTVYFAEISDASANRNYAINTKYNEVTSYNDMVTTDKTFYKSDSNKIYIHDNAYNADDAGLTNSLKGQLVAYEKA